MFLVFETVAALDVPLMVPLDDHSDEVAIACVFDTTASLCFHPVECAKGQFI
jgi:hypothetical protein